jgi:hypothetical protein
MDLRMVQSCEDSMPVMKDFDDQQQQQKHTPSLGMSCKMLTLAIMRWPWKTVIKKKGLPGRYLPCMLRLPVSRACPPWMRKWLQQHPRRGLILSFSRDVGFYRFGIQSSRPAYSMNVPPNSHQTPRFFFIALGVDQLLLLKLHSRDVNQAGSSYHI